MSCEYCEIPKGETSDLIMEVADGEGVYILHNKDDEYYMAQNFHNFETVRIVACPICARPLAKLIPLSLEELRGMDGCPIWVESVMPMVNPFHPHWEVVEVAGNDRIYISGRGPREFRTYGTTWLAYTHKIEQEGEI